MIPEILSPLANHLWQSTLFVGAAGLLTLLLKKNRAAIRYAVWLAASLKFLLPFSLLIAIGHQFEWPANRVAAPTALISAVKGIGQPFVYEPSAVPLISALPQAATNRIPAFLFFAWLCGFAVVGLRWFREWRLLRISLKTASPVELNVPVRVLMAAEAVEPGIVGVLRPALLLPKGLLDRLTPTQIDAVLTHELCHVRRRDNLAAALHMMVEAVFWFHPLVWWIELRLVDERERACDEEVLQRGGEPQAYAEGILNVCRFYKESPLVCVSGVMGSNLKKRIEEIMANRVALRLNFARKLALSVAAMVALALPIVVGVMNASSIRAQSPQAKVAAAATPKFNVVSIKRCKGPREVTVYSASNPTGVSRTFSSDCTTVQRHIQAAYGIMSGLIAEGHVNPLASVTVTGGPAWTRSDLFEFDAKAEEPQSVATMNGPVVQALLEDRFKLRAHRETREVPVYALTVASGGHKLHPFRGTCIPWDFDKPNPGPLQCATSQRTSNGVDANAMTIEDLLRFFKVTLDLPVIDETGIVGRFDFHLELSTEDLDAWFRRQRVLASSDPAAVVTDPALISAIKIAVGKLGLDLKPGTGSGEFVVIDSVERPSGD